MRRLFLNNLFTYFLSINIFHKKKRERKRKGENVILLAAFNFVIYPHGRKLHVKDTRLHQSPFNPPSLNRNSPCFHSSTIPITPLYPQRVDFLAIIKLPDLKLPPIKPTLAIHRFRNLSKERF